MRACLTTRKDAMLEDTHMISRRLLLGAAAPLAAASIIRSAMAYPDRPIRMIVPFAAG
jgi:tripartite-type tricarboxylate transporter receptor subunit TctC